MSPPFKGTINVDIRDSVPDWTPFEPPKAPGGGAERRLRGPRRRRLLGAGLLRRARRHPEHRPPRRRGRALHPVAHDGALLAHALVPPDGAQPHAQQHGLHHRGRDRVPQRQRHDPAGERHARGDPGRAGLEHLHGRQVAPLPRRRDEPGLDAAQLAHGPWLRALVRLPRRRDQPVVSGPGLRQPPRGPAGHAGGGLPPDRGPHRQGDRVHPGREVDRAGEAVLPLLRARRLPRAAPGAEGVDRQVPRPLRHGLRGDARADARPPDGARPHPARHRAAARQPDRHPRDPHRPRRQAVPDAGRHPPLGLAVRRREGGSSAAWPRCTRASSPTPTTSSGACWASSRSSATATTRWWCSCPTTAPPGRAGPTARSTR